MGRKICLKCGSTGHKFYECSIPKNYKEMTPTDKAARYCATCRKKTDHTTLDHRLCPKKREIIRERARIAREKRIEEREKTERETELITKAIDISNRKEWPALMPNKQNTQTATILTCALIEEAFKPGIFNKKLEKAMKDNNLPVVKYQLEPDTAQNFLATITGAQKRNFNQPIIQDRINIEKEHSPLNTSTPKKYSKWYNDNIRAANKKTQQEKQKTQVEKVKTEQASHVYPNIIKKLQQELDINPLEVVSSIEGVAGVKEQTVDINQLLSILETIKTRNAPIWIWELKEQAKLLITAGYTKQLIRIKFKLESRNMNETDTSFDTLAQLFETKQISQKQDHSQDLIATGLSIDSEIQLLIQEQQSQMIRPQEPLGPRLSSPLSVRKRQPTPYKIKNSTLLNSSKPFFQVSNTSLDRTQ